MRQETPIHERPVVHTVPGMDRVIRERDLVYRADNGEQSLLDVYMPPDARDGNPLPGVIFIHGGPVPEEHNVKEWGQYLSWGALAAASGFIGITFNHRYHAPALLEPSAANVVAAVQFAREQAGTFNLDPDRLCLWTCSGGGPHIAFALRDQPAYVRCLVIYYAALDIRPIDGLVGAVGEEIARQYSPIVHLQDGPPRFPIFIARAGLENPKANQIMDSFITRAFQANADLEIMNHPQGHHAFDVRDDNDRSRRIIDRTLAFMRENV